MSQGLWKQYQSRILDLEAIPGGAGTRHTSPCVQQPYTAQRAGLTSPPYYLTLCMHHKMTNEIIQRLLIAKNSILVQNQRVSIWYKRLSIMQCHRCFQLHEQYLTWLSIRRDSCKEVPTTWSPPNVFTSVPSAEQWISQSLKTLR